MKNKILLEIIIVLCVVYTGIRSFKKETSFFYPPEDKYIKVKDNEDNNISTYPIEEYVIGVIAGEMPASFNEEALKAQAIAARTFAYYMISISDKDYDLTNDTTSQVHITKEQMKENWQDNYDYYYNKLSKIVNETKDMVISYDNEIIASFYYSMSNGYTESSKEVFGIDKPYLKTVESKENFANENYKITKIMSKEEFCKGLSISCSAINIGSISYTPSNRVAAISINDKTFSGTEVRNLLNLRSTDFTIEPTENDVYITTKGFGHGVGMSQYGAQIMAEEGATYEEILKHYFQDIEIKKINEIKSIK